ncbi:MAG: alpha/beta fold hydrolase [Candidatus Zixiibacteriota bacterium]
MIKVILILILSLLSIFSVFAFDQNSLVGVWNGKLHVSGIDLRLAFNFKDSSGTIIATMDSPDQSAYDIPLDSVRLKNDSIFIYSTPMMAKYSGLISDNAANMTGKWAQSGAVFDLNLEKGEKITMNRPQEPKPPFPYNVEEVTYINPVDNNRLAGTLTIPKGDGPFPAVILITGSGAQDRDEMIFNHRPFWVIADYLTKRGIAVLRYDDRGVGGSTGDLMNATTKDFADDARAGIDYLKSRDDINIGKIGILGHSEGAIIAPMLASQANDIDFIVMLSGTGRPGDEVLMWQGEKINRTAGEPEEDIQADIELQKLMFKLVKSDLSGDKLKDEIRTAMSLWKKEQSETIQAKFDSLDPAYWEMQIAQISLPWMKYFIKYDPRPTLEKTKCPVLAMCGTKDVQVDAVTDLDEIEKALDRGGNANHKIVKLEGLNHIYQHCETGLITEYGEIEETFSPDALKIIGNWITEIVKQ